MKLGLRVLGWLVRLLPSEDREGYAEEIVDLSARRRAELDAGSASTTALFWAREVRSVGCAVAVAWWDRLRAGPSRGPVGTGASLEARAAVRSLVRQPLMFVAMVTTLAIGIGVNSAITAIGRTTLWAPLPYPDSEKLVRVFHERNSDFGVSFNELGRYRESSETLSDVAGWATAGRTLDDPTAPSRLNTARVTPNLFDVLGRPPNVGRGFERDGTADEVVLSHRLWTSRYGRAPTALGATLSLDGVPHTVVGVLARDVTYPDATVDLYTAIDMTREGGSGRGGLFLDVVARIRTGVTMSAAEAEVSTIAAAMRNDWPSDYTAEPGFGGFLVPLDDAGPEEGRRLLWALVCGAALVLLATGLNVATLLTARARRRLGETRLRRWLGASHLHVLRSYAVEASLITGLGGAGAAALAVAVVRWMSLPGAGPSASATTSALVVVVGAVTLAVAVGLTAGLWVMCGRTSERNRPSGPDTRSSRRFLVGASVVQMVSAVVLVSCSILLGRTVYNLVTTDLGYETAGVVTARVSLPSARYPPNAVAASFYSDFVSRLEGRPQVEEVGLVNALPLSEMGGSGDVFVASISSDSAAMVAESRVADAGYFRAMSIPLLAGRHFSQTDRSESPRVAVVDELFAARFFGSPGGAVGERIRSFFTGGGWAEIVGVVGHTRHSSPAVTGGPQIYVSARQRGTRGAHVVVRHSTDAEAVVAVLRRELAAVDPALPVFDVRTMESRLMRSVAQQRLLTTVFGAFALLAVLMSGLGTYSVVRLGLEGRLREIGIRRAIGAPRLSIMRVAAADGLLSVALALPIGLTGALAIRRILEGVFFNVPRLDLVSLALAVGVVAVAGIAACTLPVRGASRAAPADLLRDP